jgi:alpha-tubulin suppressor-like RCC1 family protein
MVNARGVIGCRDALAAGLILVCSAMGCNSEPTNSGPEVADLTFTSQPPATVEGNVIITPPMKVTIRDASGALVPSGEVTLSVETAPWPAPGSRVLGTVTVTAVNGVATFDNIRVDKPGLGYTFVARSGTASHSSAPFDVRLTFMSLAAGGLHTCGVTTGGTYCWGLNLYGQLGTSTGIVYAVPALVGGSVKFVQLAGGEHHTCGLSVSGAAYCWGENDQGQLGDGTKVGPDQCPGAGFASHVCRGTPGVVSGSGIGPMMFNTVTSASISLHTCGLAVGGAVFCWGHNYSGELGDGTTDLGLTPVKVMGSGAGPLVFTEVSVGGGRTCGVTSDHAVYCWGFGGSKTPVQVAGSGAPPLSFTSVNARRLHSCGLTSDGAVYCWGNDAQGQLGDGTTTTSDAPVQVQGSGTAPLVFSSISLGDSHSCGVTDSGAAYCWGFNLFGQLGDGSTTDRSAPVKVVGSGTAPLVFTTVAGGEGHTCGLTTGHAIYCWGYNDDGEVGDGTHTNRATPVPIVQ